MPRMELKWRTMGSFISSELQDPWVRGHWHFRTATKDHQWKSTCRCYYRQILEIDTSDPHRQNQLDSNSDNVLEQLRYAIWDSFITIDRNWTPNVGQVLYNTLRFSRSEKAHHKSVLRAAKWAGSALQPHNSREIVSLFLRTPKRLGYVCTAIDIRLKYLDSFRGKNLTVQYNHAKRATIICDIRSTNGNCFWYAKRHTVAALNPETARTHGAHARSSTKTQCCDKKKL